jgi:hypothetical protein
MHFCYAGGVQADQTFTGSCAGDARLVVQVRKPDGSPCYTYEASMGYLCESQSITWRDASGAVVATESTFTGSDTVTCAGDGGTVECSNTTVDSPCPLGPLDPNLACQPGVCP